MLRLTYTPPAPLLRLAGPSRPLLLAYSGPGKASEEETSEGQPAPEGEEEQEQSSGPEDQSPEGEQPQEAPEPAPGDEGEPPEGADSPADSPSDDMQEGGDSAESSEGEPAPYPSAVEGAEDYRFYSGPAQHNRELSPRCVSRGMRLAKGYSADTNLPVINWRGSLSEFFAETREACGERFGWGEDPREAGFIRATYRDMLRDSVSLDAVDAFNKALAKLDIKSAPSLPEYRVSGGVWSVSRHLIGHPNSAIYRPREKLPPKNIDIGASFVFTVTPEDIARPLARIARAAWEYQRMGGAVTITVHYGAKFSRPNKENTSFIASIRVPLSNVSAIATALSVQMFRGAFVSLAKSYSGAAGDSLYQVTPIIPGIITLTGNPVSDNQALAIAKIK